MDKPRVYEIKQTVEHIITVRALNLEEAQDYADSLGDDDFAVQAWGETVVKTVVTRLPKKITEAHDDICPLGNIS